MEVIKIPKKLKNTFLFKTRELIFSLNQGLECDIFDIDSESIVFLNNLSSIPDVGERYKVMMRAFADVLCE